MMSEIFFAVFTMQEPVKSWCNLVEYPILYSYAKKILIIQKNH